MAVYVMLDLKRHVSLSNSPFPATSARMRRRDDEYAEITESGTLQKFLDRVEAATDPVNMLDRPFSSGYRPWIIQ